MPQEYHVKWDIEVTARTPREAAKLARDMQSAPDTTATVYDVSYHDRRTLKSGRVKSQYKTVRIDLLKQK